MTSLVLCRCRTSTPWGLSASGIWSAVIICMGAPVVASAPVGAMLARSDGTRCADPGCLIVVKRRGSASGDRGARGAQEVAGGAAGAVGVGAARDQVDERAADDDAVGEARHAGRLLRRRDAEA